MQSKTIRHFSMWKLCALYAPLYHGNNYCCSYFCKFKCKTDIILLFSNTWQVNKKQKSILSF